MTADTDKRRNVAIDTGKTRGIAPLAKRHELMNRNHTAEPHTDLDLAVTADLSVIADNDLVGQNTVVTQVNADHQKVLVADSRRLVGMYARMDRHVFANGVIVADLKAA